MFRTSRVMTFLQNRSRNMQSTSARTQRHTRFVQAATWSTALVVPIVAAMLLMASTAEVQRIPLDAALMRIEINATDGDAGLQLELDGEPWKEMSVFGPGGKRIFNVRNRGILHDWGLTELFFESNEPAFDEVPFEEFLERFPEGDYTILGKTIEGAVLTGSATLSHTVPDMPTVLWPLEDDIVDVENLVIAWEAVPDPKDAVVVEYEIIVLREDPLREYIVQVPASVLEVSVPIEFLEHETDYKYEVLAILDNGNQTLTERFFSTN